MYRPISLSKRTLLGEARRPVHRLWWTATGAGGRDVSNVPYGCILSDYLCITNVLTIFPPSSAVVSAYLMSSCVPSL